MAPMASGVGVELRHESLLIEEPDVYYATKVLFVADDPGVFGSAVVDIQHIDIKCVFVI